MNNVTAVDTSLAVPLVVGTHPCHAAAATWARGHQLSLSGHAAAELYSVLTRLPGDMRLDPDEAADVIDCGFRRTLTLPTEVAEEVHLELAQAGIAGGAVYDALVGLAAKTNGAVLATRDKRAFPTYQAVGASAVLAAL
jgi:predicted nucleic acid-binding protein